MQFFLIQINYKVPLARVQESAAAHRAYISSGILQGLILVAGPLVPRVGGLVLARADAQTTLEAFFAADPYLREDLADYRYQRFDPLLHDPMLFDWVGPA